MKKYFIIFIIIFSMFAGTPTFAATSILGTTDIGPTAITIDSDGNIYTANATADTVTKITPAGISSEFGITGDFPSAITIDSDGNIYTANATANTVTKITPAGVSSVFGTTGDFPSAIAIDNDGNIYTTNRDDSTITKITPGGLSTLFADVETFPLSLVFDNEGNIYTANSGSNNISKVTPEGVVTIFATTAAAPRAITIDADGNLYTANHIAFNNGNVSKITPDGTSIILGTIGAFPSGIITDQDNNVYVTNSSSNSVTRITPTSISSVLGQTELAPAGITIDADGNLYIANRDSNSVTKMIPPRIYEVTPVEDPTDDSEPEYTFSTNVVGTITYDGPCSSATTNSVAGNNTITFNTLAPGTYDTCSLSVSDGVDTTDILIISEFTIETPEPDLDDDDDDSSRSSGTRRFTQEEIDEKFGVKKPEPTVENPLGGVRCPANLIISNFLKRGDLDGKYSNYNQGIITEVHVLQQHINRLLLDEYGNQASGPIDGIFGVLTHRGVERLQVRLNQLLPDMIPLVIDGIVGPFTREAINNSCEYIDRASLISEIERLEQQLGN